MNRDPLGWVLYDADCSFCTRLASKWKRRIEASGFDVLAVQTPGFKEKLTLLPQENPNDEIRLLFSHGKMLSGVDVYSFLFKQISGYRPLGMIIDLPIIRPLAQRIYEIIKRRRSCSH